MKEIFAVYDTEQSTVVLFLWCYCYHSYVKESKNIFVILLLFFQVTVEMNRSSLEIDPVYPCGICKREVNDNDDAIFCETGCAQWYHRVCTGLTELAYDLLTAEENAEWVCDNCIATKNVPSVKLKSWLTCIFFTNIASMYCTSYYYDTSFLIHVDRSIHLTTKHVMLS